MKKHARAFQKHRFRMFQQSQDVPKEQLLSNLSAQINSGFQGLLKDVRGVDATIDMLRQAEDKQREIEVLVRQIGDEGEMINRKLDQLKM